VLVPRVPVPGVSRPIPTYASCELRAKRFKSVLWVRGACVSSGDILFKIARRASNDSASCA
jgi:hypothetical protein